MRPDDFFALAILSAKENLSQSFVDDGEAPTVKGVLGPQMILQNFSFHWINYNRTLRQSCVVS